MSALETCLFLGMPWLLGMALLRLLGLDWRSDKLAYWGWAWALGGLGSALVLALWWSTKPVDRTPWTPALVMLGTSAIAYFIGRKLRPWPLEPPPQARLLRGPRWERIGFRVAFAIALGVSMLNVREGALLAEGQGFSSTYWSQTAEHLFQTGSWKQESYPGPLRALNPLLQSWGFLCAERISHVSGRLIIQLFAPALLLILAGSMRLWVRPGIAALLLLISTSLAPFQEAAWLAHSDSLLGVGALLILDGTLRGKHAGLRTWFALVPIGTLLALSSHVYGIIVVAAAALSLLVWRIAAACSLRLRPRPRSSFVILSGLLVWALQPGTTMHRRALEEVLLGRWNTSYLMVVFILLALVFASKRLSSSLGFGALFAGSLAYISVTGPGLFRVSSGSSPSLDYGLIVALPLVMLWIALCCGERLGLSAGTHDPRAAAKDLGRLRPLRSMLLAYLLLLAAANLTSAVVHALRAGPSVPGASR